MKHKKRIIGMVFALCMVAVGVVLYVGMRSGADTATSPKSDTKTTQKEAKPITIQGHPSDDTPKESNQTTSQEATPKVEDVNNQIIEAYFRYDSPAERVKHLQSLVTQAYQQQIEEAPGGEETAVKSFILKRKSYWNQDKENQPEVVNWVQNRLAVNGQEYVQTMYMRCTYEKEQGTWKMASLAMTPVGQTQKMN